MAKLTISDLRGIIRKIMLNESVFTEDVDTSHLTAKAQKDAPLVAAAKEGDEKAFSKLMTYYVHPINKHILKNVKNQDEADDITMMTFQRAFANIKDYDYSFAFSTWLYKIANNACIDFLRKKKLDTTSLDKPFKDGDDEVLEPIPAVDTNDNPEQSLQKKQIYEKLRKYVQKLQPEQQKIIEMRYFDEMSYDDIAQELNLPLGTVKTYLFRAKEALTNMVRKDKDMVRENKEKEVK